MFKKIINLFKRKKKEEKKPQVTFLLRDALEKSKPRVKTLIDKYVDNALKLAASSGMTIDEASRALATEAQIPLPPEQPSVEAEPTYVNDPDWQQPEETQRPIPKRLYRVIGLPHGVERKVCAHVDSAGKRCQMLVEDEAYSFCEHHREFARGEEQKEIDKQVKKWKEKQEYKKEKPKLSNGKRRKIIRRKRRDS